MSLGPFGYIQAAVIGFVSAGILFVLGDAIVPEQHNVMEELPLLLILAGAGALVALLLAMAANYVIGRRIRDAMEVRDTYFGEGELPPPIAVPPNVPQIDLITNRRRSAQPQSRRVA